MSSADLAGFAFMTPQSMDQAVNQPETAGLVQRQPNSVNGRILDARLTKQGRHIVRTMDRDVARIEAPDAQSLVNRRRAVDNALTASPTTSADIIKRRRNHPRSQERELVAPPASAACAAR
jgi:DNA-binding MarR family transcriptional regulator